MDTTSARPAASPTNEGVKTPTLSDKPGAKAPAAEVAADSATVAKKSENGGGDAAVKKDGEGSNTAAEKDSSKTPATDAAPAKEKYKQIGNFSVGKTKGKGTFGKVKQGTHDPTNEKVAIKILEKEKIKDAADLERINREITILKRVRHPNVVQLYDVSPSPLFLPSSDYFLIVDD